MVIGWCKGLITGVQGFKMAIMPEQQKANTLIIYVVISILHTLYLTW